MLTHSRASLFYELYLYEVMRFVSAFALVFGLFSCSDNLFTDNVVTLLSHTGNNYRSNFGLETMLVERNMKIEIPQWKLKIKCYVI